jgi:hypothetical protein
MTTLSIPKKTALVQAKQCGIEEIKISNVRMRFNIALPIFKYKLKLMRLKINLKKKFSFLGLKIN